MKALSPAEAGSHFHGKLVEGKIFDSPSSRGKKINAPHIIRLFVVTGEGEMFLEPDGTVRYHLGKLRYRFAIVEEK